MSNETISAAVFVAIGVVLIALGQPLATRKIAPNGVYGFCTTATLRSEAIWYSVNERAGKQFRVLGLLVAILALMLRVAGVHPNGPMSVLLIIGLITIVLSNLSFADKLWTAERKAAREEDPSSN